jgi:hypothetical protein
MKKARRKKAKLTAEQIDSLHDSGVDMTKYADWSTARGPGLEVKRVNVDFPRWMIGKLDEEAERLGVPRQSIIKIWIAERLEETNRKKSA